MDTLHTAYLETTYKVYTNEQSFPLRIQIENKDFLAWCKEKGITSWTIITAYNPFSIEYSKEENELNNQQLKQLLINKNLNVLHAEGIPSNDNWEIEKSFFVYNLDLNSAKILGSQFRQNAIVFGTNQNLPRLVWLVDPTHKSE